MNNKYYIDGNGGLSGSELVKMKRNCYYLHRALACLYASVKNNYDKIGGAYRPALLTGELQFGDDETGFDTNGLAKKLQYLTAALGDPDNLKLFKKSALYSSILRPMSCGTVVDFDDQWVCYKPTTSIESEFNGKNALDIALRCYRDDKSVPLGLDYSKLIDTLIQTDRSGNYRIENKLTLDDEIAMDEAVDAQLKTLKSHTRFKANLFNPRLS